MHLHVATPQKDRRMELTFSSKGDGGGRNVTFKSIPTEEMRSMENRTIVTKNVQPNSAAARKGLSVSILNRKAKDNGFTESI